MADRTDSQLQKVKGYEALAAFAEVDDSLDALQEYVVIPYTKIVQGMSKDELKDLIGEGGIALLPGNIPVCKKKEYFHVIPLFFYTQYRKWADKNDNTQMIIDSTYDPTHHIARCAKDPTLRSEMYEGDETKEPKQQRFYRYVEHLIFVCKIVGDHDYAGSNCIISFQKGDFRKGCTWATGIKARKFTVNDRRVPVPLWAQVWKIESKQTDDGTNKWWSMVPTPPDINPVADEEMFEELQEEYKMLKAAHKANRIRVDGDDSGVDEAVHNPDF